MHNDLAQGANAMSVPCSSLIGDIYNWSIASLADFLVTFLTGKMRAINNDPPPDPN
jgi:hypothetical protein